jgi:hypothetical protein
MRPQTRVDRFLSSPERVDVGMIGSEAGRHSGTFGNGAVAGDHDIDMPGGLTQPVERRLVGFHLIVLVKVEERDQDVGEHVAGVTYFAFSRANIGGPEALRKAGIDLSQTSCCPRRCPKAVFWGF